MRHNFNKNHCVKGKEEMLKVLSEERSPQKILNQYKDVKTGVMVKVYAGPQDTPYLSKPIGWSSDFS